MTPDHVLQSRRNLAHAFAILDALFVLLHAHPRLLIAVIHAEPFSILILVVQGMLCASAIAWWQQLKLRFIITYVLFPFRFLIGAFSLWGLGAISLGILPANRIVHYSVLGTACAAEVIRLIYTISIHRPRRHPAASAGGFPSFHMGDASLPSNPYYPPSQR